MKEKMIKVILEDIINFCFKIERYIKGLTKELFETKVSLFLFFLKKKHY